MELLKNENNEYKDKMIGLEMQFEKRETKIVEMENTMKEYEQTEAS
jgi:hypothetical protein